MYKDFAYIYDKLSFDIPYDFYAENIKKLIKRHGIRTHRMLELACGSGSLTSHFFDVFDQIDALDLSEEMLDVFSSKYVMENVSLHHKDMTDFVKRDSYDLIVILLDSINYLVDEGDLRKVFENSYESLKKGGLLVFDINSLYKMEKVFGSQSYIYEYENIFYTWDNDREDDLIYMYLNFFLENEDGSYRRIEENQVQKIYRPEFVEKELIRAGFSQIESFDEDDFSQVKDKTQRILYQAIKR